MKTIFISIFILASTFVKAQNTWLQKTSLPINELADAVSFTIGNKGYVVAGTNGSGTGSNKLFEYDPSTDTWALKANFTGLTRRNPVAFTIGNKAYVGTGTSVATGNLLNDLWEYDQTTNAWTQKANFPGTPRKYAAAFAANGIGYVGTGWDNTMALKKDFWKYNPSSNVWTQIADYPLTIYSSSCFTINNTGYVCSGYDGLGGIFPNAMYAYDDSANVWLSKAPLPKSGGVVGSGRNMAFSFSIGNSGFIGTGTYVDTTISFLPLYCQDFWEYNQTTNTWTERAVFAGGNRQWSVGFGIGNKGYAGTGEASGVYFSDLWEYTPSSGVPNTLSDVQETVNSISVYPNPVANSATIDAPAGEYVILNALGQTIEHFTIEEKRSHTLYCTAFSNGAYFIQAKNNSGYSCRKFIVAK